MLHPEIYEIIRSDEILEPETLRQIHPELTEKEFNEVMAIAIIMKTRFPWENMFAFEDIIHALNGRIPDPTRIEGCLAEELWYGLDILHRLFPDREYAIEILKYIEFWFHEEGVFIYPEYLPFANPLLETAKYKAEHGPFPLGESEQEIQAAKYLLIQTYIQRKKGII